jgi:hypothetical protein
MNASHIAQISVRGWLSMTVVITACIVASFEVPVAEWFQSMVLLVVGFYFGQSKSNA